MSGKMNKPAARQSRKNTKVGNTPPRSGRYSRSEGPGKGPERKHHNTPKD